MEQESSRGSAKILAERWGTRSFQKQDLQKLIKSIETAGAELLDYFPLGIPAPDVVRGTFRVKPKALGSVFQQLLAIDVVAWRRWDVFPIGIPDPDELLVNFESAAGYR